ncbi:uncharacterized protein LOC127282706 [Leptopilina boulardi]|uniref:uncharacterized protein LOC127282706 n=1 Tax=Leptopilina boulardi TaxID=63433 RepID=UPI0021F57220|nr:uncharacterized protein LOC127282706 [Leptopilina boulardi]XP_051163098.1 uncharacterized protein LOC127282706 [Leptopilina boulardi]
MLPSGRDLLRPLLLLIIAGSTEAFNSRQTECTFPSRWEGTWFQSGVRQAIVISRDVLSSKGKCLHNEGDKFLLVDEKACYRCVVIHEKHSNVLQYKETYCQNKHSLASLCSYITGDALLYSMFREEAVPVPCPFHGPLTFSYNRGHGLCSSPQSNVDTCTDDSKLLFRYQACPDVHGSESSKEELECLATWKEGSSRYLVGRLNHDHATSNEDRYRCFVYERADQSVQGNLNRPSGIGLENNEQEILLSNGLAMENSSIEIFNVAQSGDATCNGLFSPMEGSRTMKLTKVSSPGNCKFPQWLTGHGGGGLTWHTLDLGRSYTFHPHNATLHVTRSNASSSRIDGVSLDFQDIPGQEEYYVKILCNSIKYPNPTETMNMIVAHYTHGCRSGYVCMAFYRRDGHVVELQTGNPVTRPEDACLPAHYQPRSTPFLTLVTSSPEPRQCPYLGKFTVTGLNRNQRNARDGARRSHEILGTLAQEKVRHAQEKSDDRRSRKLDFEIQKKRLNNEYFSREQQQQQQQQHLGRRVRSSRIHSETNFPPSLKIPFSIKNEKFKSLESEKIEKMKNIADNNILSRHRKIEDFNVDMENFAQARHNWATKFDETGIPSILQVQDDYFGDYLDDVDSIPKRSFSSRDDKLFTYADLLRMKRDSDDDDDDEEENFERREKRENENPRCNSDVTTLTVGCSTADRMEFQNDCIDDDVVTAYSCHGRWFDGEGTQFVIATPLARRSAWSNDNNRPQPYRNSRRLCFMYRESGGVVSLTASADACHREVQTSPPMLAFNATSIGQCLEDNSSMVHRASYLTISLIVIIVAVFR